MTEPDPQKTAAGRSTPAQLLVAIYVASEVRIAGWIRSLAGRDSVRRRQRLRGLVSVELRTLDHKTPDIARELIESAFETGGHQAERLAQRERLSALNTSSADILIDNLVSDLNAVTTTVGRRVDDVFRRVGLQAALAQVEANEPERFAVDRVVAQLERDGITGFVDKAGKRWTLSNYAQMAVRTTTSEALTRGTVAKMAERGYDLLKVVGHKQGLPEGGTDECSAHIGKVISITDEEALPPYFPNCRCWVAPAVEAFIAPELATA